MNKKAKKHPINWRHIFNLVILLSVIPIWIFTIWLNVYFYRVPVFSIMAFLFGNLLILYVDFSNKSAVYIVIDVPSLIWNVARPKDNIND